MEAATVYMNLIRSIEDSQLNYAMSKTPFSATISLKSSFLKRFPKDIHASDVKIEKKEEAIEEERLKKLHKTSDEDHKRMIVELAQIQGSYDDEKQKSGALELEIAEFRKEILKVKKEKKDLKLTLKVTMEKFETMENSSASLVVEQKALKDKLHDETRDVDLKKNEIIIIKKETENIVKELVKVEAELADLKSKDLKESEAKIFCDKCDFPMKTYEELKVHNKCYHSHNKASQYENYSVFEPFNCFYCDGKLGSEDKLDDHLIECVEELDFLRKSQARMYLELKPFECECCGAECRDNDDLRRHLQIYHPIESPKHQEVERDQFECDICPLTYKKKVDLDFHKRGFHWG